jgi:hypothetical protein
VNNTNYDKTELPRLTEQLVNLKEAIANEESVVIKMKSQAKALANTIQNHPGFVADDFRTFYGDKITLQAKMHTITIPIMDVLEYIGDLKYELLDNVLIDMTKADPYDLYNISAKFGGIFYGDEWAENGRIEFRFDAEKLPKDQKDAFAHMARDYANCVITGKLAIKILSTLAYLNKLDDLPEELKDRLIKASKPKSYTFAQKSKKKEDNDE